MKFQFSKRFAVVLIALLMAGGLSADAFAFSHRFAHHHPRRAEVLRRDNRMGHELREDKGHLRGHYKQLSSEERAIRQQEQADARLNHGHITRGEQRQLNREENRLGRQIRRDDRGQ